jgi:hypothetical protein
MNCYLTTDERAKRKAGIFAKQEKKKERKKTEANDDLKDVGERGTEGGGLMGNAKRVSN